MSYISSHNEHKWNGIANDHSYYMSLRKLPKPSLIYELSFVNSLDKDGGMLEQNNCDSQTDKQT